MIAVECWGIWGQVREVCVVTFNTAYFKLTRMGGLIQAGVSPA